MPNIRHDCYQNDDFYVITVYCPNRTDEHIVTNFMTNKIEIAVIDSDGKPYVIDYDLLNNIIPKGSYYLITPKKVEIFLEKEEKKKTWVALKYDPEITIKCLSRASLESEDVNKVNKHAYPSSYAKINGVNWATNIVSDNDPNEPEIKDQMDHYRQFFSDSTEEQQRIMNRSFIESGGTSLVIQGSELDLDSRQKDITKALDVIGQMYYGNTDENKKAIKTFVDQYFETLFTTPDKVHKFPQEDEFSKALDKVKDTFNSYSESSKKEARKLITRHIKMMFKKRK